MKPGSLPGQLGRGNGFKDHELVSPSRFSIDLHSQYKGRLLPPSHHIRSPEEGSLHRPEEILCEIINGRHIGNGIMHPTAEIIAGWPAPNYVNPVTRGSALTVVNIIFIILVFVVAGLRFYTRLRITRSFGLDDWVIAASLVSCSWAEGHYVISSDLLPLYDYPAIAASDQGL